MHDIVSLRREWIEGLILQAGVSRLTGCCIRYSKHDPDRVIRAILSGKKKKNAHQRPVSGKKSSKETDLSSLITLATMVFSMLKHGNGLKKF